jgi:LmbE family N-acetylglucosaminyl deacetylase
MRLLFVHAHFDDFEFTAAGTFDLWRQKDPMVERRVLVCTDGAAGHHAMTREATAARRWAEQEKAAALGRFDVRLLKDRRGSPFREARLQLAPDFLPALWREIRDFEPDYLFCPPVPESSLLGVHVDHLDVAQAIRSVAYMINVPHAFSPEYPRAETMPARSVRTPVILNTYDGYMAGGHGHDLAVDISAAADRAADLAWCHESQLQEWLPWVDRHNLTIAQDQESWRHQYRSVLERRKAALGIRGPGVFEVFNVTAWGVVPPLEQLLRDLPNLDVGASRLERLGQRLDLWRSAAGE